MTELTGKRYLVVGGETPAGRRVAVGLAESGADVAIATLRNETASEFAVNSALNELWAMGRRGLALVIDASDGEQVRAAAHRAEEELGRLSGAVVVGEEWSEAEQALRLGPAGRIVLRLDLVMEPDEALASALRELGG